MNLISADQCALFLSWRVLMGPCTHMVPSSHGRFLCCCFILAVGDKPLCMCMTPLNIFNTPFHMHCHLTTLQSIWVWASRLWWFASIRYEIGGLPFSSFDIEHGILRGNAASPIALPVLLGKPQWAGQYFNQNDPRNKLVSFPPCSSCVMSNLQLL